ncbi:MAG: hypothetical protein OEZ06_21400 [Myxococcales bacterium]|nr:hypothetical protein [Myxococcales bacterium]
MPRCEPKGRGALPLWLLLLTTAAGCASAGGPGDQPSLRAVLWQQRAQEYRALTESVYQAATAALESALEAPEAVHGAVSEAALEAPTGPERAQLPPAVIVDVDETVLDNSPFNARMIMAGNTSFDREAWQRWVNQARARAIPGALAFAAAASARGVTLFYVTNRDADQEEATAKNLRALGFPLPEGRDVLLMRGEVDDSGSDKAERRRRVASSHRVLLLIGDNLGDFLSGDLDDPSSRDRLYEAHRERFGRDWFMLPNAVYGSWQKGLPKQPQDALDLSE